MKKLFVVWIMLLGLGLPGCDSESQKIIRLPNPVDTKEDNKGDIENAVFPQVDILFVVDDSGSMGEHQTNLINNITLFVGEIHKLAVLKYHIGVVTTDMINSTKRGHLQGTPLFVENSTVDGAQALMSNLDVGTRGHWEEESFSPVKAALSPPLVNGYNAGFYRPNAHLVVIFLVDSEDQSHLEAQQLQDFLMSIKNNDASKILSYGVIIPSGTPYSPDCKRDQYNQEPRKIEEFLALNNPRGVGDNVFNICDPDFGRHLTDIKDDLVSRIGLFVYLKDLPVVDTIEVFWGQQKLPRDYRTGWIYDNKRNALHLGEELQLNNQAGDGLIIKYLPAKKADEE